MQAPDGQLALVTVVGSASYLYLNLLFGARIWVTNVVVLVGCLGSVFTPEGGTGRSEKNKSLTRTFLENLEYGVRTPSCGQAKFTSIFERKWTDAFKNLDMSTAPASQRL